MQRPASTCRSPTRRRARASRRGASRGRRRRPRAAPRGPAPRRRSERVARATKCIPSPRTSSSGGQASPSPARRATSLGAGVVVDAGGRPAPASGRSGNSPVHAVVLTNGHRGMEAAAARRQHEVGRRPGIDDERLRTRRSRARSAAGRACTGAAARGTPRRPCPSRRPGPAYMTASRSQVWATTARSWVTKTTLTPSSRRRLASSLRI